MLVAAFSELKITRSLEIGGKTYSELKSLTGLSDRWLTIKLKILEGLGVVQKTGNRYKLTAFNLTEDSPLTKISLISTELYLLKGVLALILFGTFARNEFREDSDIDFVIVMERYPLFPKRVELKLEKKYEIPIDAFWFSYDDFIKNLMEDSWLVFGLVEGCKVIFDKKNNVLPVLEYKKIEVKRKWFYDEEAEAWIPRKYEYIYKQPSTT
ncbi:MAG: nucleotidyltransferase domain-containing protein [Candidatus Bathyarchaeia archaeon]